ncbi:MAG: winged helix-turn-helix domain-containing protein [Polyangiaceae bacterium]
MRRRRLLLRSAPVTVGALTVDFQSHSATRDGESVEMTSQEMKLLAFFLRNEGSLLPRQRILAAVWGADYFGTDRTVDNFVNRLRTKIERDPKEPVHLTTVRGGGYRLTR